MSLISKKDFKSLVIALLEDADQYAREDERRKMAEVLRVGPGLAKARKHRMPLLDGVHGLGLGKGSKRDPSSIKRLERQFFSAVRRAPGSGVEQLSKQLGVATVELQLPIRHLVEAGKIKKKGKARAVKYYTSRQKV